MPVTFGVPFDEGEVTEGTVMALTDASGKSVPTDTWPLAYWPDGSVKWLGAAATPIRLPRGGELFLAAQKGRKKTSRVAALQIAETASGLRVTTDSLSAFISKQGAYLMDSLLLQNRKVAERLRLVCTTQSEPYTETTRQVSFSDYQSDPFRHRGAERQRERCNQNRRHPPTTIHQHPTPITHHPRTPPLRRPALFLSGQ